MDHQYTHPTVVHVVRACLHDDAIDLVAIGGEQAIDVVLVKDSTACSCIASFYIGSRITAIAWSSKSVSPTTSDDWSIELTAASDDFGLHLLNKSAATEETVFPFGGGLSGHHGKVNDMTFCGGWGEDSTRYLATVSDDKMLMVWDLNPTIEIPSYNHQTTERPQPTAYVIPFPRPLTAVTAHATTSKEFLVADCRGSVFITDWRSDPEDDNRDHLRHSSLVELVDPHALSASAMGYPAQWSGSVAWRSDTTDVIGAVYGTKFSIWELSNLRGGKPYVTGNTFADGGHKFRWSPTYSEYFAISTRSPTKGAVIHVHNINYVHAQPTVFTISPRPHYVQDFDFLAMAGIPRIAVAIGRKVTIFTIGLDQ